MKHVDLSRYSRVLVNIAVFLVLFVLVVCLSGLDIQAKVV